MLPDLVEEFIAFVCRYYKYKVKTFRTDNKTSLEKRFTTWIKGEGYAVKESALYTLEQGERRIPTFTRCSLSVLSGLVHLQRKLRGV
jgi:hypothetical protein